MISEDKAMEIWRRAKAHPVGIALRTDNRYNLTQRLYQVRARHREEEDFSDMMLSNGPTQDEVWVLHRPAFGVQGQPIGRMTEKDLDDI